LHCLCGMVSEMAVVFIFDLVADVSDLNSLSPEDKEIFTGRRYETFGQKRRIDTLLRIGVIPKTFAKDVDKVRTVRREYLHFLSKDYGDIEDDACECYSATCRAIKSLIGLPLGDKGKIRIPRHLEKYMASKGIIEADNS